jgi:hypothetical protein
VVLGSWCLAPAASAAAGRSPRSPSPIAPGQGQASRQGEGEKGRRGEGEKVKYPALAALDAEPADPDAAIVEPGAVELFVVTDADIAIPDPNAGQVTREWIDYCAANGVKLTTTPIKRYGRSIKAALGQGFTADEIKRALGQMFRDRVASRPALLEQYLIRIQQGPEMPPERMSRHQADAERRAPEGKTSAQQLFDTLTRPA